MHSEPRNDPSSSSSDANDRSAPEARPDAPAPDRNADERQAASRAGASERFERRTGLVQRWLTASFLGASAGGLAGAAAGALTARSFGIGVGMVLGIVPGLALGFLGTAILVSLFFALNVAGARDWTAKRCYGVAAAIGAGSLALFVVFAELLG